MSNQNPEKPEHSQSTTHDLGEQARAALEIYAKTQAGKQGAAKPDTGVFRKHMTLKIEIGELPTPLLVSPEIEMLVGRRDPVGEYVPDLDLTPYAGYQMGVSRKHALIRREEDRLFLVDLDSRNGTFINNERLLPNKPYILNSGDQVRFGKVLLHITFNTSGES